jgi:hypothetical protein
MALSGTHVYAEKMKSTSLHLSGEIRGRVVPCDPRFHAVNATVYIPGVSIMAKIDEEGNFRLLYVPEGAYDLRIESPGERAFTVNEVEVFRNQVSDLGDINTCRDCLDNSECPDNSYCQYEGDECGNQGTCRRKPGTCPLFYAPVCGCDGNTYDNQCLAARAGISVAYAGVCETLPTSCAESIDCDTGEYCSRNEGECGSEGTCARKPQYCIVNHDPVCGCDGKTYINECLANTAGISILHKGECAGSPLTCTNNRDCGFDYFCSKIEGECSAEGKCTARPQICMVTYDPVCGCDGKTYMNECLASKAGVSIAYEEVCGITPVPIPGPPPSPVPTPVPLD